MYWENGEVQRAIQDLNVATRLNPSRSASYQLRGSCWHSAGDLDKALTDYNQALRLDPNDPVAWRERA